MILDTLATASRKRVERDKTIQSLDELKSMIYGNGQIKSFHKRDAFAFEMALKKKGISGDKVTFICEVKKASPSKGIIADEFPYQAIASEYELAGADAISVLTEPIYFKGSDRYLSEISSLVNIPVLRKDFTIDKYQIYQAKIMGADAVLLICTLLDTATLKHYLKICDELGMSALVEAHTEDEVKSALQAGARIIGVNNRNLQTFEVDIKNSVSLRNLVPRDIIFVAESGIKTSEDIKVLSDAGVNAVLIGETLMRCKNKREILDQLKGKQKV